MNDEHDRRRAMPGPHSSGGVPGSGVGPHAPRGHGHSGAPDDNDRRADIDLRQVHFDDAFIDALSHDVPTPTRDDTEYQLAALLSGWRHEVLSEPAPPIPGVAEVERAMAARSGARRGGRVVRSLRVVAGAAAIAVVAAAGLTVVSEGAQPGDSLWGVKKVVFAQAASETQAAYDVRSDLEQAEAALASGDVTQAQQLIARAQTKMGPVRDSQTRDQMNQWITRLQSDESGAPTAPTSQRPGTTAPDASGTETSAPQTSDQTTASSETSSTPSTAPTTRPTTTPTASSPPPTTATTTTTTPAG